MTLIKLKSYLKNEMIQNEFFQKFEKIYKLKSI